MLSDSVDDDGCESADQNPSRPTDRSKNDRAAIHPRAEPLIPILSDKTEIAEQAVDRALNLAQPVPPSPRHVVNNWFFEFRQILLVRSAAERRLNPGSKSELRHARTRKIDAERRAINQQIVAKWIVLAFLVGISIWLVLSILNPASQAMAQQQGVFLKILPIVTMFFAVIVALFGPRQK